MLTSDVSRLESDHLEATVAMIALHLTDIKQQRQQYALDHLSDRIMWLEEYEVDDSGDGHLDDLRKTRLNTLRFLRRVWSATRYNLDMSLGVDPTMTGGMPFNDPRWDMIYNMRL